MFATVERLPASDGGGAFASGGAACSMFATVERRTACRIDRRGRFRRGLPMVADACRNPAARQV